VASSPIDNHVDRSHNTIGRHLMQAVLDRVAAQRYLGVRLVHAAYHACVLSLYAKLGFTVRDFVARVTGAPLAL
jgi:predicted N-acetyltransferase YhbS